MEMSSFLLEFSAILNVKIFKKITVKIIQEKKSASFFNNPIKSAERDHIFSQYIFALTSAPIILVKTGKNASVLILS